jgi:hypothetical protein
MDFETPFSRRKKRIAQSTSISCCAPRRLIGHHNGGELRLLAI